MNRESSVTDEDLQSLGQKLREAREAQALTLEEVEAQTRIRAKFLRALESGDISILPSATHARGFLRNYVQFLHLNVDEIIEQFNDLTGTRGAVLTGSTAHSDTARPVPPPSSSRPAGRDASSRPAPAAPPPAGRNSTYIEPGRRVGPGVPRTLSQRAQPRSHEDQENGARSASTLTVVGQVMRSWIFTGGLLILGFAAIIWLTTTRLSQVSGDQLIPPTMNTQSSVGDNGTQESVTPGTASSVEPDGTAEGTPTAGASAITGPVVLDLEAEQRTWLRVEVDGARVFEGQVEPGDRFNYNAQQQVIVRAGNGEALVVTYNGRQLGPLGERGEVVERFFTTAGQVTPTPAPTSTSTGTSVPSPTPSAAPTTSATP